jgi:hypothetical protein
MSVVWHVMFWLMLPAALWATVWAYDGWRDQ